MGELILRCGELGQSHADSKSPLTLISYDRVHSLFLELLEKEMYGQMPPLKRFLGSLKRLHYLPEGETHPEARWLITSIMRDVLHFAFSYLPKATLIIMEAPLIGHRGEDAVEELNARDFPLQTFIVHSPAMRERILSGEDRISDRSARKLAMRQIRNKFLQREGGIPFSPEKEAEMVAKKWEHWLLDRDGILLGWDPADDEDGFEAIKQMLKNKHIQPDPIAPSLLLDYTTSHIQAVLRAIPDLVAFATRVWDYQG
ncbi:MAG TPA: hypothetical protein VFV38_24985 [Ktedonobacteraceae bacterium]|nr:hypothetical protein [Ktedonobacteraceae bacterium]